MTLRDCRPGHEVRLRGLAELAGDQPTRLRLAELGFLPGAQIRVISRGGAGGAVVAVGDARIALDAATSRSLVVEPVTG